MVRRFTGNYSEYLEASRHEQAEAAGQRKADKAETGGRNGERGGSGRGGMRTRKLSYNEQKEWDEIELRISALERRQAELKAEIDAAGSDYARVEKLFAEEQRVSSELDAAIERWAELSALIEELEQSK
jgi:ATP-binding cassette subfamily F protein uup